MVVGNGSIGRNKRPIAAEQQVAPVRRQRQARDFAVALFLRFQALGTAIRVAHDTRRARAKRDARDGGEDAFESLVDAAPSPEQALDARRAREMLDRIIEGLPEDVQPVFVLFEIDGLSKGEIAEALSIPEGTVASRLRRAREHFDAAVARIHARLAWRKAAVAGGAT